MNYKNWNRNWKFETTDRLKGAISKTVQLPHDAALEMQRDPNEPAGGPNGFFQEGNYTYSKTFQWEEDKKYAMLRFEGVYHNSKLFVNHSYAGSMKNGYSDYIFDITSLLHRGENLVTVEISNNVPSCRWYTGGGIYRDVSLLTADRLYIVPESIRITTEEIEDNFATLCVEGKIKNRSDIPERCTIRFCYTGQPSQGSHEIKLTAFSGIDTDFRMRFAVTEPALWDDEHPNLYEYTTELITEEITDREIGTFGIRKLTLDTLHGLRINGRSIKLKGGCIHADNGVLGMAEFAHPEETRITALRKAGYNAIRCAHHPASRILLSACDKAGMYVMDEFTDTWTKSKTAFDYSNYIEECWEADLTAMVRKDYNHPSVILYSIGNEIPELCDFVGASWSRRLAGKLHTLDKTRYVTNGINIMLALMYNDPEFCRQTDGATLEAPSEINKLMNFLGDCANDIISTPEAGERLQEACDTLDITGYNYGAGRYEADLELYPDRILIGTESYPKDLYENWSLVEKHPRLLGDFSWSAWDYIGEAGIGQLCYADDPNYTFYPKYPAKLAYVGDFDLNGFRRPVSYWREIVWGLRKEPYIAVQPPEHHGIQKLITNWVMTDAVSSWTWTGYEGKPVTVEVYSDEAEAALFRNGKLIDRKNIGTEKPDIAFFETEYEPGTLEAEVYDVHGQIKGHYTLSTAGSGCIHAKFDCDLVEADGSNVTFLDISFQDEHGTLNMSEKHMLTLEIEGPGMISGLGNADPIGEENFLTSTACTYEGRLRSAIRGVGETGTIHVHIIENNKEICHLNIPAK